VRLHSSGAHFWTPVGLQNGTSEGSGICNSLKALVGPPGFEPGTSCTPSKNRTSVTAPIIDNKALRHCRLVFKCGNFAGIDRLCGNCAGGKIHRPGRISSLLAPRDLRSFLASFKNEFQWPVSPNSFVRKRPALH
jgi:hypothetical protein